MAAEPDILPSHLTDAQREAVQHTGGPLLVVAGPGAGKTAVMVHRTVHLIRARGVDPEAVLVTTFTNEAADELFDRLYPYLGSAAGDLHISTIHSFCRTLLERHPAAHPWGPGFEVLDGEGQFLFVYAHLKELGLGKFPKSRVGDFVSDVVSTFNLCTNELVEAGEFVEEVEDRGAELLGLEKDEPEAVEEYRAVAGAYGRYRELLREEGLMDFGLLQRVAHDILVAGESDDEIAARRKIQGRFWHVLVDEYQDTNRLQVRLLRAVSEPERHLCAVGDDDQSIYGFRGATPTSFVHFEDDFPEAHRVELRRNFRSAPPILDAAGSLIEENEPNRMTKELFAERDRPRLAPVMVHRETAGQEAEAVVGALERWKEGGLIERWSEVTLLFRSVKSYAGEYIQRLEEKGIPHRVTSDGGFFDREDVAQVKQLFTFCGWKRRWFADALDGPLLRLESDTLAAVADWDGDPVEWSDEETLDEMGVEDEEQRRLLEGMGDLRRRTLDGEFDDDLLKLFYETLRVTGYFERCCEQGPCGPDRPGALAALLNLARYAQLLADFHRHVRSTNTYLLKKYVDSLPYRHLDEARPEVEEDAVRVMTAHSAKGLEFPVVVLGAAMQNRFPGRYKPAAYPVPPGLRLSREEGDLERHYRDERRLFYVGMTRAEDLLVVGTSDKVNKRGGGPTQFLDEIDHDLGTAGDVDTARLADRGDPGRPPVRKRVSYSALHSYRLCPLQYFLLYECEFSVPEYHYFTFGRLVHRALEVLHRRGAEGETVDTGVAEKVWEEVWSPGRGWSEERSEELREMGLEYLKRYVDGHGDRFDRVQFVEEDIELPVPAAGDDQESASGDGLVVSGRLDLACEAEDGGLEVVDFKVRTRMGLEILRPDLQVQTYGLAVEEAKDRPVRRVLLHLLAETPGEDVESVAWAAEDARQARDRLREAGRGILERDFEPRPGLHCRLCDFRSLCPASRWREEQEGRTETGPAEASAPGRGEEIPVGAAP